MQIPRLQGRTGAAVLGADLRQQHRVVLGVLDVGREVLHPPLPTSSLEVVVEPAEEDLLWRQAQELLQGLVLFEQPVELRVQLDVDLAQQTAADDLPDETEDQVLPDLDDVPTANVDD